MVFDRHPSHMQKYVTRAYRNAQFLHEKGSFQGDSMFNELSMDFAT